MLDKTPNHEGIEQKWGPSLQKAFDPKTPRGYLSIIMPPPNVTGSLHMGHALTFTIQDIWIRFWRMQGYNVLAQPGLDHAGIATQMMVERDLGSKGLSRQEIGREKFEEAAFAFKETSGQTILKQLKRLGVSANWDRLLFTLDAPVRKAVKEVFVKLYDKRLIYKSERLVYWDPFFKTALSNLEVQNKEVAGQMWTLRYFLEGGDQSAFIDVATTRPETLFADVAVAVHPKDPRYQNFIGRHVKLPLSDRSIPVIADDSVEIEKGTGALKVTPAHDFVDFEIGKRHNLDFISIIDEAGCLTSHQAAQVPKELEGEDRLKARPRVLEMLKEGGLLIKEESMMHTLPFGDRSGALLEPFLTKQWFFDVKPLAQKALKALEKEEMAFCPKNYANLYKRWLSDIEPWCLSRQLWWGHDIPAWQGPDGQVFVAMSEDEAHEKAAKHYGKAVSLTKDPDVLDTWFSSALWPLVTLGWPEKTEDLKRFYPTSVLVTGFDIIFFWVARMAMMGVFLEEKVPFKTVYIHGIVRDQKRQKMSKTKGNVIDPLDVIKDYGVDALRLALASLATPGHDMAFSTQHVLLQRNFLTKLWNATRFCIAQGGKASETVCYKTLKQPINLWLLKKWEIVFQQYLEAMKAYRFYEASHLLYHFLWGTYCDLYVEMSKVLLRSDDEDAVKETQEVAGWVLGQILKMLYPFVPFVASELWEHLSTAQGPLRTVLLDSKQEVADLKEEPFLLVEDLLLWAKEVRFVRTEFQLPFKQKLALKVQSVPLSLKESLPFLCAFAGLSSVTEGLANSVRGIQGEVKGVVFQIPLDDVVDMAKEAMRLQKKISALKKDQEKLDAKLSRDDFLQKAPKTLVLETQEKQAALQKRVALLEKINAQLS